MSSGDIIRRSALSSLMKGLLIRVHVSVLKDSDLYKDYHLPCVEVLSHTNYSILKLQFFFSGLELLLNQVKYYGNLQGDCNSVFTLSLTVIPICLVSILNNYRFLTANLQILLT